ncbi:MAG: nucleoside triphosphate pyrophosphohydrolase family protein [Candidatus Paceibacterota bacterium]
MDFNQYQKEALKTDSFGGKGEITSMAFISKLLGLVGESGEVAEKFKKIYRNNDGKMSPEEKELITKELGDVLWYLSVISNYLDVPFQEIAEKNIAKLKDRLERDVIKSAGDTR